jgi:hypothetical protein
MVPVDELQAVDNRESEEETGGEGRPMRPWWEGRPDRGPARRGLQQSLGPALRRHGRREGHGRGLPRGELLGESVHRDLLGAATRAAGKMARERSARFGRQRFAQLLSDQDPSAAAAHGGTSHEFW